MQWTDLRYTELFEIDTSGYLQHLHRSGRYDTGLMRAVLKEQLETEGDVLWLLVDSLGV